MKNLQSKITQYLEKDRTLDALEVFKNTLTKQEKEAIEDAERLSDMYDDIKPESYTISGNHLFVMQN